MAMTKDEALKLALQALEDLGMKHYESTGEVLYKETFTALKEALADPEQYTTDAMKVRQAVAQALHDDVYAEELEQPEAKQSGTISITMPAPVAYLCENAVGHKYFRWKKPSSTYKPIPLYTTPPQRKPLTDEEIGAILEGVNAYGTRLYTFARAIEAAHNIKGGA
jgi:gamma-glutamyltranspeptidase